MAKKERVLIVGGGFGGIKAAIELADNAHFAVTLLSEHSDFRYYPALYRTATGGSRASSRIPLAEIFKDKRITVVEGVAVKLDRDKKQIITKDHKHYEYDKLILALGVVTNYFGIPGLEQYSYGIKSNADAIEFKEHLHKLLLDERKPDLNYVIVGAGPTGIELAGALPAYLKSLMASHGIRKKSVNIHLVDAAPRLLPRLPKKTSRLVGRRLRRLGIRLHMGKLVQGQTADALLLGGHPISSHTVIWTAGTTNHPFFSENKFMLMNHGKVATDMFLMAEPNIYVIGDNANTPYSGLAQTAVRDGAFVADNLKRLAKGLDPEPYHAKAPITVIPAGHHWSVVNYRRFSIHGYLGWLLREAADFIAFHDLESWPKAARQWAFGLEEEEDCPFCKQAAAAGKLSPSKVLGMF